MTAGGEYLVMWFCKDCFEEHYFGINNLPDGDEHCPYCEHCGGELVPEDDMAKKCKHETTSILGYHSNVSLEVCDWGCGAVLVSVTDDNGISHVFTPDELLALRERLANNHTAVSVYQRDIAALRERVAALEDAFNKADHYIGCTIEDEELFAWQEYDAAKRKLYQPTAEGGE